ncbi:hypothetical protein BH09BAC3_BH09BAC3_00790 [soil metagenome]
MNQIEPFLKVMLVIHIAGGTLALITGLGAMLTKKGGKTHRNFGKAYFWSMTIVFIGALALALGHTKTFLLMVAFFSYYMTVRGYRILYLKNLSVGQKPNYVDWIITGVSGIFIVFLFLWGGYVLVQGEFMGIVGLVFGAVGSSFLYQDLKNFFGPPPEKMHWWYGHIASMGGSYIAAVTAFVVVNFYIGQLNFVLWILPGMVGGFLITSTIRKYKAQFTPRDLKF